MNNAIIATARAYLTKRSYSCAAEEVAFIEAFCYGWAHDHSKEPGLIRTEWPNAYGAGFNEGWHYKDKALSQ